MKRPDYRGSGGGLGSPRRRGDHPGSVALMPLLWEVEPVLVAKGVNGVTLNSTWNIFDWNKQ
jgi:hypothetical protein